MCVVLYYHAVRPEERASFGRQMDELLSIGSPIRADRREPLQPGRRYVAVTFDDGFVSVVENALPELRDRRIPCTIFVPTGSLGTRPSWLNSRTPGYMRNCYERGTDSVGSSDSCVDWVHR
jgi:peptidoglycan/xylan/chitin deacetylase (PgdA/CDA1 family)